MSAAVIRVCQIAALRARRRWTMRAHRPMERRPPCRSRLSWFFRAQMTASTRWNLSPGLQVREQVADDVGRGGVLLVEDLHVTGHGGEIAVAESVPHLL